LRRGLFIVLCASLAALFAGFGVWQIERWHWKTDLIAKVDARLAALPVPAPSFAAWTPDGAYTRVRTSGVFLHDRETAVQAVTELGPGWWIVTPLKTSAGTILVNRGFVAGDRKLSASRDEGQVPGSVEVTGLLRASEPGGAFLRSNAPAQDRWYSRDVEAIAHARSLPPPIAPYFIDADATPNGGAAPIGGLTVVSFRNNHVVYAITWFVLCALCLTAIALIFRHRPNP